MKTPPTSNQGVIVTIVDRKPTGYMVQFSENSAPMLISKNTFLRRVENGVYHVTNDQILSRTI